MDKTTVKKFLDHIFELFLEETEELESVLYSKANPNKTPTFSDISSQNKPEILKNITILKDRLNEIEFCINKLGD